MSGGYECECPPSRRSPKPNGTCANCGHWLPGEREKGPNLVAMWSGTDAVKGLPDPNSDAYQFAKCATCNHQRIDHIIGGGCLKISCGCSRFAATNRRNER